MNYKLIRELQQRNGNTRGGIYYNVHQRIEREKREKRYESKGGWIEESDSERIGQSLC